MFANAQELLAYTYEGRQLRVPEEGAWVAFDCTDCGTHTETTIRSGLIECYGCDKEALAR